MNQDIPIPSSTVAAPNLPVVQAQRSPVAQAWQRFRHDSGALLGAVIVGLLLAMAVFAPLIAPHDPAEQFDDGLTIQGLPVPSTLPSSTRFIMGSDPSGRDMFSRIVYGARVSLTVGV